MATPKPFPTLVQLEQREGTLFQVLGNLTKRPYWFHNEYLKTPKTVHLEAWLVEAIFGEWPETGSQRGLLSHSYPSPPRLTAPQDKPLLRPWPPSSAPVACTPRCRPFPSPIPHGLFASCAGPGGEHIPHVECVSQTLLHVNQWDPEGDAEILVFGRPSYQRDVSRMIVNLAYYHRQLRAQSTGPGMRGTLSRPWVPWEGSRRFPALPRQRSQSLRLLGGVWVASLQES